MIPAVGPRFGVARVGHEVRRGWPKAARRTFGDANPERCLTAGFRGGFRVGRKTAHLT